MSPNFFIERLIDERAGARVEPLWREYVPWVVRQMQAEYQWPFDDPDSAAERHHQLLAADLPRLTGPSGRLLLACGQGEAIGVVALKPVDQRVAEVKRMYVRPDARGQGAGSALLETLIAEARGIGYRQLRLETLDFMERAIRLYQALGFVEASVFPDSEVAMTGLTQHTRFMELDLVGPR